MIDSPATVLWIYFLLGMVFLIVAAYATGLWEKKEREAQGRLWYGVAVSSFFLTVALGIVWVQADSQVPVAAWLGAVCLGVVGAIPLYNWQLRTMKRSMHGTRILIPKRDKKSTMISFAVSLAIYWIVSIFRASAWVPLILLAGGLAFWITQVAVLLWVRTLERRLGEQLIESHEL